MPGYDYADPDSVQHAGNIESAVRETVINYFHDQLGWCREKCEDRVRQELNRHIPKMLFDEMSQHRGWKYESARLLDVGSGQGGAVLEALLRGAEAYGVEPGGEFAELSRRRLQESGFNPDRIIQTGGEDLPFDDESFHYVITLQVLEHVENPRPILEEIYRVLKPGGEAVVRCENYLAFREQHYRVPWLPLLPKTVGSLYLRTIGRDPSFLNEYVFYTTYPQVWALANDIGFTNVTLQRRLEKLHRPFTIEKKSRRVVVKALKMINFKFAADFARFAAHIENTFSKGVDLKLVKTKS